MSVFEISEGLPKPKRSAAMERMEYNRQRVEFGSASEVAKCHPREREPPPLPLRPVKDHSALAEMRQNVLLNIVVPDWAVRIHEENIATAKTPKRPDGNMQTDRGHEQENERQHHHGAKNGGQGNENRNVPPFGS